MATSTLSMNSHTNPNPNSDPNLTIDHISTSHMEEPPSKRLKPTDLPLTSAQRQSIQSTLHTYKKKGEFDALRKSIYSRFYADPSLKAKLTSALTGVVDSELDRNPNLLSKGRRQAAPLIEGAAERAGCYKHAEADVDRLIWDYLAAAGEKLREIRRGDVGEAAANEEETRGGKSDEAYAAEAEVRWQERKRKREEEVVAQKAKEDEERRKQEEERRRMREEEERKERVRQEMEEQQRRELEVEKQREQEKRKEWEREMEERRERKARQDAQWERERIEREEKERKKREKEIEEAAMQELIEEGKRLAAKASRSEPIDSPRRGSDVKSTGAKESALEAIMRKEKLERESARAQKSREKRPDEMGGSLRPEESGEIASARERHPPPLRSSIDDSRPISRDSSRHDDPEHNRDRRQSMRGYYDSRSSHYDDEHYYSRSRTSGYKRYDDYETNERHEYRRSSTYYDDKRGDRDYDGYHSNRSSRYPPSSSDYDYRRSSRESGYYGPSSRRDYPYSSSRLHPHDHGEYSHDPSSRRPHGDRIKDTPAEIDRYMPSTSARANEQSSRTKIVDRSKLEEDGKEKGDRSERRRDDSRERDRDRDRVKERRRDSGRHETEDSGWRLDRSIHDEHELDHRRSDDGGYVLRRGRDGRKEDHHSSPGARRESRRRRSLNEEDSREKDRIDTCRDQASSSRPRDKGSSGGDLANPVTDTRSPVNIRRADSSD